MKGYTIDQYDNPRRYVILQQGHVMTRWDQRKYQHVELSFRTMELADRYLKRLERSNEHHFRWIQIWVNAMRNVPEREATRKDISWVQVEHPVTVPEYIKGVAKKYYQMNDGKVFHKQTNIMKYTYGKQCCLARLLGYVRTHKKTGKPYVDHNRVYNNKMRGSRPRDDKVRALLERLAQPDGKHIAVQMLTEMGIAKRYKLD